MKIGQYSGKLTALYEIPDRQNGLVYWLFRCDCGKNSKHPAARVESGRISTCGCSRGPKRDPKTPIRRMFAAYKHGAQKRELTFELSLDQFVDLVFKDCSYCGSPPERREQGSIIYAANGIDRVNNAAGYTLTNSVTACKRCNSAKMDGTLEEFQTWIKRLQSFYLT